MAKMYRSRTPFVSPTRLSPTNLDPAPLALELRRHHFSDEPGKLLITHVAAGGAQPGGDVVSYRLVPATVLLPGDVRPVDGSGRRRDAVIHLSGSVLLTLGEGIAWFSVRINHAL